MAGNKSLIPKQFSEDFAEDIRDILVEVINLVRSGEMSPDRARGIGYCCSALDRIVETKQLQERIEQLENTLEARGVGDESTKQG